MELCKVKRRKDKVTKSTIERRYEQARNIVKEALKDDLDGMVDEIRPRMKEVIFIKTLLSMLFYLFSFQGFL